MYENRITAFIDILGFRNIIQKTTQNDEYAKQILAVLNSMKSEEIIKEMFVEINEKEADEEKMQELLKMQSLLSEQMRKESSLQVTHFSDSIVISIGLENDMYAMSMIEYVVRLIYRLWRDFKILIRGAIVVDKFVHIENGAIIGPALVKAYDYETNLANYPRIILDDLCYNIINNSSSYNILKNMFKPYSEEKNINGKIFKIQKGYEMNLATAIKHLLNSPFTFHEGVRKKVFEELNQSKSYLEQMIEDVSSENIKKKYEYLITEIENTEYPKA